MASILEQTRYIPGGSTPIEGTNGIVYVREVNGVHYGIAYKGTAKKSTWNFRFRNLAERDRTIKEFFESNERSLKLKEEQKQARNVPSTLKVGDIVYNSWGFEQTNVDFYEVVRANAAYVWLQSLNQEITSATGSMSGYCVAVKGTAHGDITKHKVNNGNSVCFRHGCGSVWDGKPKYYSSYA